MAAADPAAPSWAREGELASAVARSIRCNVPLKPATFDYTSGLPGGGKPRRGRGGDSEYSRWLGMEHYHDERTSRNYWVSPSTAWRQNGLHGPGYDVDVAGEPRKLEPGRSD